MTSRPSALLGGTLLTLLVAGSVTTFLDPDLFHCLTLGRELFASGHLPREDVFAYTPTRSPVVHHEWLAGALHYLVVTYGGEPAIATLRLLLAGTIVAGALLLAHRQGAALPSLVVLGPLGLGLLRPGLTTIRAQIWTLLFTMIVLWLLESDRRGRRTWVAIYLLLHFVWLNTHAGFVIGLGLIGLHAAEQSMAGRPVRHVLVALGIAAALVVMNPYGFHYYAYLWDGIRLDRSLIGEWRPLWDGPAVAVPVWIVSVGVVLYALRHTGLAGAPGWLLVLVTALLCLRYQRHVSIYGVVWLAQVPPLIQRARLGAVLDGLWSRWPAATAAVLAIAVVAAGARLAADPPWRVRLPSHPDDPAPVIYPVGAVAHLERSGFRGNLLVPFELGAFVSWELYPAVRVSIDGRYEVAYAPALLEDHVRFYAAADGWQHLLEHHPTDAVLVPVGAKVARLLEREAAWTRAYADDAFQVWTRRGAQAR